MTILTPKQWHAVLLHLMIGITSRDCEPLLGIAQNTVIERCDRAVARITDHLNGDGH